MKFLCNIFLITYLFKKMTYHSHTRKPGDTNIRETKISKTNTIIDKAQKKLYNYIHGNIEYIKDKSFFFNTI